jgi:hypothetical protein
MPDELRIESSEVFHVQVTANPGVCRKKQGFPLTARQSASFPPILPKKSILTGILWTNATHHSDSENGS